MQIPLLRFGMFCNDSFCSSILILQWRSSPMVGVGKFAVPLINLLIGTYTFTTGLHVEQVMVYAFKTEIRTTAKCYIWFNLYRLCEDFLMILVRTRLPVAAPLFFFTFYCFLCTILFPFSETLSMYFKRSATKVCLNTSPSINKSTGAHTSWCSYTVVQLYSCTVEPVH